MLSAYTIHPFPAPEIAAATILGIICEFKTMSKPETCLTLCILKKTIPNTNWAETTSKPGDERPAYQRDSRATWNFVNIPSAGVVRRISHLREKTAQRIHHNDLRSFEWSLLD
jgi:hypothetical protein